MEAHSLPEQSRIDDAAASPGVRQLPLIDGRFVDNGDGHQLITRDPSSGDEIANIVGAGPESVDAAVTASRRSFSSGAWSACDPQERKDVLLRLAHLVEQHALELAVLDSLEAGKPIADCLAIDVPETVECFQWYAELIDKLFDSVAPTPPSRLALVLREPVGVVGLVVPWNFPLLMAAWKVAPSLAVGNSVILKPAEQSSLSALRLGELALEAGVPPGVLNVLPGVGEVTGAALGRHPDVDAVSFTGSTEVGRAFLRYSAESNLKRISLECGGKSPQIVLGDSEDLATVADNVINAAFWNAGQNCSCGSRLLVDSAVVDDLLPLVLDRTQSLVVGKPLELSTNMGTIIDLQERNRIAATVDAAVDAGAEVAAGGSILHEVSGGAYMEPTILTGVTRNMHVAREEVFGPVLAVTPFGSVEEAISLANDSKYGLAASVYTSSLESAHKVMRQLRAGTVSVNCYSEGSIATPFGGYRESGFGGRDNGVAAIDQYVETKTIWVEPVPRKP